MSDQTTSRMLTAYFQDAAPTSFLSGFFQTPEQNFHNSEKVEIDIERSDEDIATVLTDLSTGAQLNSFDKYTNKEFTPAIYDEAATLNSFDLIKRMPGDNPFKDISFQANATVQAFKVFRKLENKVRRAVELMSSQVLQTGKLELNDSAGNPAFLLDYAPKVTHFPTVAIAWSAAGSTKLKDLQDLAEEIRSNGLHNPNVLVFGSLAWNEFIADTAVQALLDNRRIVLGGIRPENRGNGAHFKGTLWVGDFEFEMWTYTGRYKHPVTGVKTKFMDDNKVIMLDSEARYDLTFGSIPLIERRGQVLTGLPERMVSTSNGFGMTTNSWVEVNGKSLSVSAGTRPLVIPTAIDTYGCLTTIV